MVVDDRFAALGRRPRVLVVEDSETARGLLQAVLEARQLDVAIACDGGEALEYLKHHLPDLIVTDGLMPVVDGPTLLREVRENPRLSRLPVIALTSGAPGDWQREPDGPQPDAILSKSPDLEPFLKLVHELLARTP